MPDIQLRQQVVEAPGLSCGRDFTEQDLWAREQFPAAPDLSCYPELRWGVRAAAGPATRTLALSATEAQDAAAFAVTVTAGGAAIDFALGAVEAKDVAAFAVTVGHPFALVATEAKDIAAFAASVAGTSTAPLGTIIGGFGPYPQPAATPEWLETLPRKAVRKVERLARRVRAGEVEQDEAAGMLAGAFAAGDVLQAAQGALAALLMFHVERIAELARNEAFLRAQREEQAKRQQARNDNALRVLMLMTLH